MRGGLRIADFEGFPDLKVEYGFNVKSNRVFHILFTTLKAVAQFWLANRKFWKISAL